MSTAISLPFSFDANGSVAYTSDQRKIMQDRVVLVTMTLVSERIMRPGFGTHVRASAFENFNEALVRIKQEISIGFSNWLSYLNLIDVTGSVDPADGHLAVSITYKYGSNDNPETVVVKTDILSRSGDVISEVPNGNQ